MSCVEPSRIDEVIVDVYYEERRNGVILCALTLQNGTVVRGESPDSREDAFAAARDKVWALENYLLAQQKFCSDELKAGLVR